MNARIILIDDERPNLESLERILKSDGHCVECFTDGSEALSRIRSVGADVVLTDLRMPRMSGLEFLDAVKLLDPSIEIVLLTAYGTVELAVEAMKKGAYDFITKPLQRIPVLKTLHKALEKRLLVSENMSLREELKKNLPGTRTDIIGHSQAMREIIEIAGQAASSRANVFIEGESGTGKGLLAEYIHAKSGSGLGLFVNINCTAVPENLLEAEMFGYEAGAFTGANKKKPGRVELADKGTLFLDEIGIAPLSFQAKLLRFLQDGEFERLGSNDTRKVETRVISATNSDLKKAIAAGQLREDLYYRLNVIHLKIPPLRERVAEIPLLAQKFVEQSAKKNRRDIPLLSSSAMDALEAYQWPGNIRELQNVMERVVVLNRTGVVKPEDFPVEIGNYKRARSVTVPLGMPLRQIERLVMGEALKCTDGDKKLAATLLGIHPRTIYRFLEQDKPENSEDENCTQL